MVKGCRRAILTALVDRHIAHTRAEFLEPRRSGLQKCIEILRRVPTFRTIVMDERQNPGQPFVDERLELERYARERGLKSCGWACAEAFKEGWPPS